jgi:AraC-like DNA-binding protein
VVALLYLDPDADAGRWAAEAARTTRGSANLSAASASSTLLSIPPRFVREIRPRLQAAALARGDPRILEYAQGSVGALGRVARPPGVSRPASDLPDPSPLAADDRVGRALALLRAAPGRRVPLARLAATAALSASRFGRLFRDAVELPVRRYPLWLRFGDALRALAAGASLSGAAHDAGFADSAHLTRTFPRTIGITPSSLTRSGR